MTPAEGGERTNRRMRNAPQFLQWCCGEQKTKKNTQVSSYEYNRLASKKDNDWERALTLRKVTVKSLLHFVHWFAIESGIHFSWFQGEAGSLTTAAEGAPKGTGLGGWGCRTSLVAQSNLSSSRVHQRASWSALSSLCLIDIVCQQRGLKGKRKEEEDGIGKIQREKWEKFSF